jgi:hypothetical protein
VGRGITFFSLLDITSRDKQNWAMANKTHHNWRNKKMQKAKKKNPIKLRVGLKTYMSIGWWITQQQQKKNNSNCCHTCAKIALGGHPRILRGTSRKL